MAANKRGRRQPRNQQKAKKARRGANGSIKGGQFEREISVALSKWVSGGQNDAVFWRSAMSGGRATIGHRKGFERLAQSGDLTAISPEGHDFLNMFFIECKSYQDLRLKSVFKKHPPKQGYPQFWRTARYEAAKYNKLPMLIMKQNYYDILVVLNKEGFDFLAKGGSDFTFLLYHKALRAYIVAFKDVTHLNYNEVFPQ